MVRWDWSHDPEARPLGCNGKYGGSGRKLHRRRGEEICLLCRDSDAHYRREVRRGQKLGRPLQPCGTNAAASRHRVRGEPLDIACQIAEIQYTRDYRAAKG